MDESLASDLIDALSGAAAVLPKRRWGDAVYADRMDISSFAVAEASRCALSVAATADTPFVPSAATSARGVAYETLRKYARHGSNAISSYRTVAEEALDDRFPWEWVNGAGTSDGERAQTEARATRLVGALARLPELETARSEHIGVRAEWRHPKAPIRVRGRVDLLHRTGKAGADKGVILLAGAKDGRALVWAAFEALVLTLAGRASLGQMVLLYPDEGRRYVVDVDDDLLGDGIEAAATLAAVRAARYEAGGPLAVDDERFPPVPGSHCRWCALARGDDGQPSCEAGFAWLRGLGSWPGWRGGDGDESGEGAAG